MNDKVILRENSANIPSTANVLIEALPYIQKLANKIIVIKFGGNAMIDDRLKNNFARDVVLLKQVGLHPVIIHGGGPQITTYLEKMSIKSEFVDERLMEYFSKLRMCVLKENAKRWSSKRSEASS